MGWETVAIMAFNVLSASQTQKEGRSEASAIARQGEQDAERSADNTLRSAGKLQTSFLQSGLTLEGGPMDVLSRAFAKGQTDIANIRDNANAGAKNAVNSARTKALQGLASSVSGVSFDSIGNTISDTFSGLDSASQGFGFGVGYDLNQTMRNRRDLF